MPDPQQQRQGTYSAEEVTRMMTTPEYRNAPTNIKLQLLKKWYPLGAPTPPTPPPGPSGGQRFLSHAGLPSTEEEYKRFLPYSDPGASQLPFGEGQHLGTLLSGLLTPEESKTAPGPLQKVPIVGPLFRGAAELQTRTEHPNYAKLYSLFPGVGPPAYEMALDIEKRDLPALTGDVVNILAQMYGGRKALEKPVSTVERAAREAGEITPSRHVPTTAVGEPTGVTRRAVRSITGMGKRFVQREAVTAAKKSAEARSAYAEGVRESVRGGAEANRLIQERNAAKLDEYAEDVRAVQEMNRAGEEALTERGALSTSIQEQSLSIGSGLRKLESKVRAEGSAKFEAIASATEEDSVPASELASVVDYAETNLIRGSKESIKQFKDITRRGGGEESLADLLSAKTEESETLGFRDLQGYYTELGERMASESLPGDVYRAVKFVRLQIGERMREMAERHGMGDALTEAREFWAKYEQTFHDMRAVSQGGSPVARAFRAKDPSYMAAPFLGKAAARAQGMVAAYSPELGQAVSKLSGDYQRMTSLPRKFTPRELPAKPTLTPPKTVELPESVTPVDIAERLRDARRAHILRLSKKFTDFNVWDVGGIIGLLNIVPGHEFGSSVSYIIMKHGLGALLEHPRVIEWLARPTESDFRAISKLPPSDLAKVREGIAALYQHQIARGLSITPNDAARKFLGIQAMSSAELGQEAVTARASGHPAMADVLGAMAERTDLQKAKDVVKVIESGAMESGAAAGEIEPGSGTYARDPRTGEDILKEIRSRRAATGQGKVSEQGGEGEGGGTEPPRQPPPPTEPPEPPEPAGTPPPEVPFSRYTPTHEQGLGPMVFLSEEAVKKLESGTIPWYGQNMSAYQALDRAKKLEQAAHFENSPEMRHKLELASVHLRQAAQDAFKEKGSGVSLTMMHPGDVAQTIREEEFHNRQRMASRGPYFEGHVSDPEKLNNSPMGKKFLMGLLDLGHDLGTFKRFPISQVLETAVKIHKGDWRFRAYYTDLEMAEWLEAYYMQVAEANGPEALKGLQDPRLTNSYAREMMKEIYGRVQQRLQQGAGTGESQGPPVDPGNTPSLPRTPETE